MTRRVLFICGGISLIPLSLFVYSERCWYIPVAIRPKLEAGHENCAAVDLESISIQKERLGGRALSYQARASFQLDPDRNEGVLAVGLAVESETVTPFDTVPDLFRIHFSHPPVQIEDLPPEHFPGFNLPYMPCCRAGPRLEQTNFAASGIGTHSNGSTRIGESDPCFAIRVMTTKRR